MPQGLALGIVWGLLQREDEAKSTGSRSRVVEVSVLEKLLRFGEVGRRVMESLIEKVTQLTCSDAAGDWRRPSSGRDDKNIIEHRASRPWVHVHSLG